MIQCKLSFSAKKKTELCTCIFAKNVKKRTPCFGGALSANWLHGKFNFTPNIHVVLRRIQKGIHLGHIVEKRIKNFGAAEDTSRHANLEF